MDQSQPDVSSAPELLAPAGNWECAKAAIENGADAIYFGLHTGFNARARADNFHLDDLPQLITMLHRQGVLGYVTLNTLVFTDELSTLEENVRRLADAGVDAVLVQDLGAARLIRAVCPEMTIHASTQMTLTCADAIEQASQLGVSRAVLARELSISEIRKISQATSMPLEVFVHGALCVAYSGQCLTSESFGGRSANRGQCAQACRLPYDLYCDDEPRDLGPVRYLLSPQDLAAHDLIPQLMEAGVCSLKIEGRLKRPEYVANVCLHYRQAIDAAVSGQPKQLNATDQRELELSFSRGFSPGWLEGCDHKRLVPGDSSANRGVLLGRITAVGNDSITVQMDAPVAKGDGIVIEGNRFASEEIGSRVYEATPIRDGLSQSQTPTSRSARSGGATERKQRRKNSRRQQTAAAGSAKNLSVESNTLLQLELRRGTLGDAYRKICENTQQTEVDKQKNEPLRQHEPPRSLRSNKVSSAAMAGTALSRSGCPTWQEFLDSLIDRRVFKTDDPQLSKRLRKSFEGKQPSKRVPVHLSVKAAVAQPLTVRARVEPASPSIPSIDIQLCSQQVAEEARKHPLSKQVLREQFSRLGGTVYELGQLDCEIAGRPMLPLSVLGELRRRLVEQLEAQPRRRPLTCADSPVCEQLLQVAGTCKVPPADSTVEKTDGPKLRVLCRSMAQLRDALAAGVQDVIADFHDIREYRQAVAAAREAQARIELATLRIHKPGEDGLFRALVKHSADGWLVRNLAAMRFCQQQQIPFACDFSLNITNPLTAQQLMNWGAERVTASYDLNRDQLLELAARLPADWLEVVIHQHMPMFHMEHCVFCSVLSPGKNKSNCGRPCDRHHVDLRDRVGAKHVLHADIGCRNTLYNGTAQSGAEAVSPLMQLGVRQFRIELLRDANTDQTRELITLYRDLLSNKLAGSEVWQRLQADNRIGVTRGTLEQPRNPLAIL